jgi:hypothetical protein
MVLSCGYFAFRHHITGSWLVSVPSRVSSAFARQINVGAKRGFRLEDPSFGDSFCSLWVTQQKTDFGFNRQCISMTSTRLQKTKIGWGVPIQGKLLGFITWLPSFASYRIVQPMRHILGRATIYRQRHKIHLDI